MVDNFNMIITFFKEGCLEAEPGEQVVIPISRVEVINLKSISNDENLLALKFHNLIDINGTKYDFDLAKVYGFEIMAATF